MNQKYKEIISKDKITQEEFEYIFEKDEKGAFLRLIIPASENVNSNEELNLIGKLPENFTLDEIVIMKKYASLLSNKKEM